MPTSAVCAAGCRPRGGVGREGRESGCCLHTTDALGVAGRGAGRSPARGSSASLEVTIPGQKASVVEKEPLRSPAPAAAWGRRRLASFQETSDLFCKRKPPRRSCRFCHHHHHPRPRSQWVTELSPCQAPPLLWEVPGAYKVTCHWAVHRDAGGTPGRPHGPSEGQHFTPMLSPPRRGCLSL